MTPSENQIALARRELSQAKVFTSAKLASRAKYHIDHAGHHTARIPNLTRKADEIVKALNRELSVAGVLLTPIRNIKAMAHLRAAQELIDALVEEMESPSPEESPLPGKADSAS